MASIFDALSSALGSSKLFKPDSTTFSESTTSYFSAFENELKPICVVKPTSVQDVSNIIKTFKNFAAAGVKLAIRGGGHMSGPGSANIDGGVTIDMRDLRGIEVNADKTAISIASGEHWSDVYEKLDPMGLGVSGGRATKVGVGGFCLGGGLSFFSTSKGFVSDSVLNFQVVLTSGQIVNANASENEDLWLALRGGGNNFGIVTRYDMALFEQGKMWGGNILYDISTLPQQFQALYDFVLHQKHDSASHYIMSMGVTNGFKATMANIYYSKPEENPPELKPFTAILPQFTPMNTLRIDTLKNFAHEQSAFSVNGLRQNHMTTTFKLSLPFMTTAWEMFEASLANISDVTGLSFAIGYQPLPIALLKSSADLGGNSLGLDPDQPLIIVCLFAQWTNKEDDEKVLGTERELVASIDKKAKEEGVDVGYKFMNYCFDGQDPIAGYGDAVQERLRNVSKRVDPDGFFQKSVPGGFKLN